MRVGVVRPADKAVDRHPARDSKWDRVGDNQRRHPVLINTILKEMGVPAPDGFGDATSADLLNLSA